MVETHRSVALFCRVILILPFAAVSVWENGDAEFFTALKPDHRSFRGVGERRGWGVYGYSGEAEAERLPFFTAAFFRLCPEGGGHRREGPGVRAAPGSAPGSGSPGARRLADHHVPHSRGFASLSIIINPACRIYSGNAGGHMA